MFQLPHVVNPGGVILNGGERRLANCLPFSVDAMVEILV